MDANGPELAFKEDIYAVTRYATTVLSAHSCNSTQRESNADPQTFSPRRTPINALLVFSFASIRVHSRFHEFEISSRLIQPLT
jgi:hypothetical protein